MKKWRKKLKSSRGETLVELLASILIASLSVILLTAGVAVSVNINKSADETDEKFYQELSLAEKQENGTHIGDMPVALQFSGNEGKKINPVKVYMYGGEHLRSYKAVISFEESGGDG